MVEETLGDLHKSHGPFKTYLEAIYYVRRNWQNIGQPEVFDLHKEYLADVQAKSKTGITPEEFGYKEDGNWRALSWQLAEKQNLSEGARRLIVRLHESRVELFKKAAGLKNPRKLKELADELESVEFELQEVWGFERDRLKHSWWYRIPRCACPKMDNSERLRGRIIMDGCPVHSPRRRAK